MKTKKWSLLIVPIVAAFLSSCQDWGEWDGEAGNQIYPRLEKIGTFSFDEELDPTVFQSFAYDNGNVPEVVYEDKFQSNVLHLQNSYVRIANPLTSSTVQNGVSLTFWVKQVTPTNSDTGDKAGQDVEGAIYSFQNEDGSHYFFFTANGWISYKGADGTYEDNNPSEYKTGIMSADEWHYIAMLIRNDGYALYVDGLKKIDKKEPDFDFTQMVQFIASSPYLYLGYGSGTDTQECYFEDFSIYRNQITSTQIKVPGTNTSEETIDYIIVGNEDYSTTWWTEFSDLVTMTGDQEMHLGFYNHTNESANWNNWVLAVTNGKNRDESGYAEYFVLRADAYGWGDASYNGDHISHNFNFDTFTAEMNGAYVDLVLKRSGNRLDMTATITATSGTVYTYTFYYEGVTTDTIGAFLTCEGAYLMIDPNSVFVGHAYNGNYIVGPENFSAGWWSYFSDLSVISGNTTTPFVYTFYNNSNATSNWNNYILVVTNGKNRDEAGYAEYFVLRADAYGWGDDAYNGDNISNSYNWDSFATDLQGAYCTIILNRNGSRLDFKAKVTTADGEKLDDYTFYYEGISTTDIGTFLTVEAASLDIRHVGYYPFVDMND